jgi:carbonic anhydrase
MPLRRSRQSQEQVSPSRKRQMARGAHRQALLSCMDPRVPTQGIPGYQLDGAYVLRNAGGRASTDVLRSLIVASRLLGVREVIVVHHTDCGMAKFTDEDLRQQLLEETGVEPLIPFLPFSDLEESVRDDMAAITACPFLSLPVKGFVYDIDTGRFRRVWPHPLDQSSGAGSPG